MFLSAFCGSLVVRGIAGMIASGCAYFVTVVGSSVPPGTATAKTRSIPGKRKNAKPAAAPPPRTMKPRREMVCIRVSPHVFERRGARGPLARSATSRVRPSVSVRRASPFPPERRLLSAWQRRMSTTIDLVHCTRGRTRCETSIVTWRQRRRGAAAVNWPSGDRFRLVRSWKAGNDPASPQGQESDVTSRKDYPAGVPCWIDVVEPDTDATRAFYGDLFAWTYEIRTPEGAPQSYSYARRDGLTVAGVGGPPNEGEPSGWTQYVRVDSVDDTVASVEANGGKVVIAPYDVGPSGRVAT